MKRVAILMLAVVFASGAIAQTPAPAPTAAEDASLHGYGDSEKTCQEWTDSCRSCTRSEKGEPLCPNIGISCQPKAIACLKRAEPGKAGPKP